MPIHRFYDESSNEFKAQEHIRDNIFHDPTITVNTMAACAAYAAVLRYVTRGRDEYPIAPRNIPELRAVLNNHTTDVIHSLISQTRARLPAGGYGLARRLASESIDSMLRVGDNAEVLLAVHLDPLPIASISTFAMHMASSSSESPSHEQAHEDGSEWSMAPATSSAHLMSSPSSSQSHHSHHHFAPLHHTEVNLSVGMPTQEGGGEIHMTAEALHFQQHAAEHHHTSGTAPDHHTEHSLYDAESSFSPQWA